MNNHHQISFNFAPDAPPPERFLFIDKLHFLMGMAYYDDDLRPWLSRWSRDQERFAAACRLLGERFPEWSEMTDKLLERLTQEETP